MLATLPLRTHTPDRWAVSAGAYWDRVASIPRVFKRAASDMGRSGSGSVGGSGSGSGSEAGPPLRRGSLGRSISFALRGSRGSRGDAEAAEVGLPGGSSGDGVQATGAGGGGAGTSSAPSTTVDEAGVLAEEEVDGEVVEAVWKKLMPGEREEGGSGGEGGCLGAKV
jgi:hypothetical protein